MLQLHWRAKLPSTENSLISTRHSQVTCTTISAQQRAVVFIMAFFAEHPKYHESASDAYRNVILKKAVTVSTSVLSEIQQCMFISPCNTTLILY